MNKNNRTSKGLHISLWIAQVVLAGMLLAGILKSTTPISELSVSMSWVNEFPAAFVRFIGITQLLGSLGLILPSLLRIKPILTPLAALGFLITMFFAIIVHVAHGEANVIMTNIILGALAAFIAWGRYKKAPITAK
jgi:putative oxidoreductase